MAVRDRRALKRREEMSRGMGGIGKVLEMDVSNSHCFLPLFPPRVDLRN